MLTVAAVTELATLAVQLAVRTGSAGSYIIQVVSRLTHNKDVIETVFFKFCLYLKLVI